MNNPVSSTTLNFQQEDGGGKKSWGCHLWNICTEAYVHAAAL